jgi:hypothetical protein
MTGSLVLLSIFYRSPCSLRTNVLGFSNIAPKVRGFQPCDHGRQVWSVVTRYLA